MISGRFICAMPAAFLTFAGVAGASTFMLDFEGIENGNMVESFYGGGTSSDGRSGSDFGVVFRGAQVFTDYEAGGQGNFAHEPTPHAAIVSHGTDSFVTVAGGFRDAFSFFYSAAFEESRLTIYDEVFGAQGAGKVLATIELGLTPIGEGDPTGGFSTWRAVGVEFSGIARSIVVEGKDGSGSGAFFDNLTFGSATPGLLGTVAPVPSPASLPILLGGLAAFGVVARRRVD